MRLGRRPLEQADGCVLAYPVRLSDGVMLRKGHTLTAADLEALALAGHTEVTVARFPRVAGVILAAGRSSRMGDTNKLLEAVQGRPMIRRVVEEVMGLPVDPVVVVTGHDADPVRETLAGLGVRLVHNPDFADGMSTSIRTGVEALAREVDGALIILGDMPWLSRTAVAALLDAFDPEEGRGICVPFVERKRGNPVLWASRYFADLCALRGDVGGRDLLAEYVEDVHEVQVTDDGVLRDVDTPEGLEAFPDDASRATSPSTSQG